PSSGQPKASNPTEPKAGAAYRLESLGSRAAALCTYFRGFRGIAAAAVLHSGLHKRTCSTMGSILARRRASGATSYTATIRLKAEGKIVHRETATFPTRALAKEWMTRREAELAGQRARGEVVGTRMTFAQMIDWYS